MKIKQYFLLQKVSVLTLLFLLIVQLSSAQCDYTLELNDEGGNGWEGSSIQLVELINGVVGSQNVTLTDPPGDH